MSVTLTIPEIPLQVVPTSSEARELVGFKWASPEVGTRHKLGGSPEWLQQPEVPICSCGKSMSFYGQLDSIGDDVCLADCGIIYVFVCFGCFETKSVLQSS
jgi:hypothetical protein